MTKNTIYAKVIKDFKKNILKIYEINMCVYF